MPDHELRRALALARPKMGLMILLGAFCGLRCQEIAGLHWTDLQTDHDGQAVLLVREGKGGHERVVPVPEIVLEAARTFGRRRSGPMFYGHDAGQQHPQSVSGSINNFLKRNGFPYTAHQLRHRYGTTAYMLTKDLRLTQELLGHSSPNTTARYAAYDKSQTVDMVKAMDAAWSGGETAPPVANATPESC
jgi:integrase/recombinase XerC